MKCPVAGCATPPTTLVSGFPTINKMTALDGGVLADIMVWTNTDGRMMSTNP
jgi:hypothetical protein